MRFPDKKQNVVAEKAIKVVSLAVKIKRRETSPGQPEAMILKSSSRGRKEKWLRVEYRSHIAGEAASSHPHGGQKLKKTRIEWSDYSLNPIKGLCPMACPYCYARRMYKRFKWNPKIRFDPNVMRDTCNISKPSKFFIGSTMELFGDWVKPKWLKSIFAWIKKTDMHTYIFLTKCPDRLHLWNPFPDNVWVGVSAWDDVSFCRGLFYLKDVKAKIKFVSLEPFLSGGKALTNAVYNSRNEFNWLIIGQQTPASKKTTPKIEDIRSIVEAADKAGIPVFLKDNLKPLFEPLSEVPLRQELPCQK